jgi:hypothetical protein
VRETLADADPAKITVRRSSWPRGVMAIVQLVSFWGGLFAFAWLLKSLISDGTVPGWTIVVMAVATLSFWCLAALGAYRDYRYYALIAAAHDQLKGRLSEAATEQRDEVEISPSELDALSQAESRHAARQVKAAVDNLPETVESAWGIALTFDAKKSLDRLAKEQPAAWERVVAAIQSLQVNPRPPEARPSEHPNDVVELTAGSCAVDYRLEDESQHVYVISIGQRPEKASDA